MPRSRYCPGCAAERPFEQPPCPDGHGSDCPEWLCRECGWALLLGPTPVEAGLPPARVSAA